MGTAVVHKLGPGQLTFGETGTTKEFGVLCKAVTLSPEVEDGEIITVLSGDTVEDSAEVNWKLEGELYQDYSATGLAKWCLDQNGQSMPFTFRPRSDQPLTATGTAVIRPIPIGGDVKTRNTSAFSFKATEVTMTTSAV